MLFLKRVFNLHKIRKGKKTVKNVFKKTLFSKCCIAQNYSSIGIIIFQTILCLKNKTNIWDILCVFFNDCLKNKTNIWDILCVFLAKDGKKKLLKCYKQILFLKYIIA